MMPPKKLLVLAALSLLSSPTWCAPLSPFDDQLGWPELERKTQCWDAMSLSKPSETLKPLSTMSDGGNGQGVVVGHLALEPGGKTTLLLTRQGQAIRAHETAGEKLRNHQHITQDGPPQKGDAWHYIWQDGQTHYTLTAQVAQYHIWRKQDDAALTPLLEVTPEQALAAPGPYRDEVLIKGILEDCHNASCVEYPVVLSSGCEQ